MFAELFVWETITNDFAAETTPTYSFFERTDGFLHDLEQDMSIDLADQTYYDIYLRSDMKKKRYVLTYDSLSYFGDAGGILTVLLLLGKFI